MSARRATALVLFGLALVMVGLAALTPLRSAEIERLDARATELGREWTQNQGNQALAEESNRFFNQARDLEPPLAPLTALGGAMLLGAAGIALLPKRESGSDGLASAGTGTDQPDGEDAESTA